VSKKSHLSLAVLGTTFAVSLAAGSALAATDDPFALDDVRPGFATSASEEGGDGSCGGEGKCGEGSCGDGGGEGKYGS